MVEAQETLAEVLRRLPQARGILLEAGVNQLSEEEVPADLAGRTLGEVARERGLDETALVRELSRIEAIAREQRAPGELAPGEAIRGEHVVARVLEVYPQTLEVFLRFGFAPLADPELRATLARNVTVAMGAAVHGLDQAELLRQLNAAREGGEGR